MVKAYLRYEPAATWGVVCSGSTLAWVLSDSSTPLLAAPALESVHFWDLRRGVRALTLTPPPPPTPGVVVGEVTVLAASPSGSHLAAGHTDGAVRLWDAASGELLATFRGHRGSVSALRFSCDGATLLSGGRDTEIVVWDVGAEAGLVRLRGHRGQVTDLVLVERAQVLVSASKDATLRCWDLRSQHCVQVVPAHRAELWSLDLNAAQTRLAVGGADDQLRWFRVCCKGGEEVESEQPEQPKRKGTKQIEKSMAEASSPSTASHVLPPPAEPADVLSPMGFLRRRAPERVASVRFGRAGLGAAQGEGSEILLVQSAGKAVELLVARSGGEALRHFKRRCRRKSKSAKGEEGGEGKEADAPVPAGVQHLAASDELEMLRPVRSKHRLRSAALPPPFGRSFFALKSSRDPGEVFSLVVGTATNGIEVHEAHLRASADPDKYSEDTAPALLSALDGQGHRGDVRSVALSPDDSVALSTSAGGSRLWDARSGAALRAAGGDGYGTCCVFAPGGRHALVGTKEGSLQVIEVSTGALASEVRDAHQGAVWSLALLADESGVYSASADHDVKQWEWVLEEVEEGDEGSAESDVARAPPATRKRLALGHVRTLRMTDDALCVRASRDGRLLAVSLLDATIRVFFADSFKFFVALYGHSLPALCMDISSDGTLLASGSADKTLKIWGLDFGDCRRSLRAHSDSVMAVAFVPNTHYVFTAGKDGSIAYWDADKFEQLLVLQGHHGAIWGLAVSSLGDAFVTGGADRSLRRWERTDEPFFVEEEREKRMDSLFEADLSAHREPLRLPGAPEPEAGAAPVARPTTDSVAAADELAEALDLAADEEERLGAAWERAGIVSPPGSAQPPTPPGFAHNPVLLGASPGEHVLRALRRVKAPEVEAALLLLPFAEALRLLGYLCEALERSSTALELLARAASALVALHAARLSATHAARGMLLRLQKALHARCRAQRDALGVNIAALKLAQQAAARRGAGMDDRAPLEAAAEALRPLKKRAEGVRA